MSVEFSAPVRTPLISYDELNEQDKRVYDYADEEDTFFIANDEAWDLGDFVTFDSDPGYPRAFTDSGYHAVFPLSHWNGAVLRLDPEDNDYVVFAYYTVND